MPSKQLAATSQFVDRQHLESCGHSCRGEVGIIYRKIQRYRDTEIQRYRDTEIQSTVLASVSRARLVLDSLRRRREAVVTTSAVGEVTQETIEDGLKRRFTKFSQFQSWCSLVGG